MSDETPHPPAAPEEPAAQPRASTWRRLRLVFLRLLALVVAAVAALVVAFFTIDLGPYLRELAEREGSKYIERPMHIGRLSARLTPGTFVVEDLVIEGLNPSDPPFLTAERIEVDLPWWTIFSRELIIQSVTMTDWRMVVETFPATGEETTGRHNFPRFTRPRRRQPAGPRRFTTTVRSVLATRGEFTFRDHGAPWSTVSRNLTVRLYRSDATDDYRGRASFSDGTVRIQSFEPFTTAMQSSFRLEGSRVVFDEIALQSDGARSMLTGEVDLGRWPEQIYRIRSDIDFPTQKAIFFHDDDFTVSGKGEFKGTFHLFKGGRELKGTFRSPVAGVNDWRFPDLRGSVLWLPDRLEITNTTTALYGGTAAFDFRMAPLGTGKPATATWDVRYSNVNLARLTDFLELEGIRLAGLASGRNRLEWPVGKWAQKRGSGEMAVQAPSGTEMMPRELPVERAEARAALPEPAGPFNPRAPLGYVPIEGRLSYEIDPVWIVFGESWVATRETHVAFDGRTAYGERSRIPFHVTSLDWQESDRLLAGIMTAFGSPTGAVPFGGYGEFEGVMLNAFRRPRIEGTFTGERLRAWDVLWGSGRADIVIENGYVFVADSLLRSGDSEIRADGQFSLGYPRRDGGEEINARVRLNRRPLSDLRHAFRLDEYPVEGLVSGEYHLYGGYETPFGYGNLLIEEGAAYREPFERATASLRFEGNGVRLDRIAVEKGGGSLSGAAWVGWNGTYSFNADGRRIPLEAVSAAAFPRAPLSGLLQLTATGTGTFEEPRYDVKLRVDDLYAGDEGIGQVTGRIGLRGDVLNVELEAASPRLVVSGSGRIALTPEMDAEATIRFADTSLDPYIRFFEPRLSPFTRAVAGGTVRVVGELANPDHLVVETAVESLDLELFDYNLRNAGRLMLTLDQRVLRLSGGPDGTGRLRLTGEGTELELGGEIDLRGRRMVVDASGTANLGILQGFFRDLRSRGTARLKATIVGPLEEPVFSGSATIADGRLRHFSLPHSLEAINGTMTFDADGIRVDGVQGRVGQGRVVFGGRIGLDGFAPGEFSLTAVGERMQVRYPEGFRSLIDADLSLLGTMENMLLSGSVTVHDALWARRIEATPDLFDFGGGDAGMSAQPGAPSLPIRFDVDINAPGTLRIQNNVASMVASAELNLQGTYDRPLLFGRAEIERGDVVFEGNRYLVTRGSVDFFNPSRIEPFFDIEAETRVRLPGQTYRVNIALSGTTSRLVPTLDSDPPLPQVDIIGLLFGQATDLENAELRALRPDAARASEEALLGQGMARLLTSPISEPVGRVLGETLGIDTVQITPTLGNETDPLAPSGARLIIGKRISSRVYLTFARALGNTQRDQILVLEYDQNDHLGWVVTQNGDGTFAVDFRVRHRF